MAKIKNNCRGCHQFLGRNGNGDRERHRRWASGPLLENLVSNILQRLKKSGRLPIVRFRRVRKYSRQDFQGKDFLICLISGLLMPLQVKLIDQDAVSRVRRAIRKFWKKHPHVRFVLVIRKTDFSRIKRGNHALLEWKLERLLSLSFDELICSESAADQERFLAILTEIAVRD